MGIDTYIAATPDVAARYLAVTPECRPVIGRSPRQSVNAPAAAGSIHIVMAEVTARYFAVTPEVTARYIAVTFGERGRDRPAAAVVCVRSFAWSIARPIARSISRSLGRSLGRSFARSLG